MKKHLALGGLVVFALFCVYMGFRYIYYIKDDPTVDSTMVAAWFSLAGVMLFAAALIYQIKEFKLQREELIKSVEAQTNTSNALEEQKNIMLEQKQIALEQKTDAFLMSIIEGYNNYKGFRSVQEHLYKLNEELCNFVYNYSFKGNLSQEDKYSILAAKLLERATPHVIGAQNRSFLLFSWNMLKKIEESINNYKEKDEFFRVYFHNHLSVNENILLLFSELLCENTIADKKVFINIPTIQKLIDILPNNIEMLRMPDAAKNLYDAFANTEMVINKNLVF